MRPIMFVLILAASCGPSDTDMEARYASVAIAEARVEALETRLDGLMRSAPSEDSMRAILRSPLADSLAIAQRDLRVAQREYER